MGASHLDWRSFAVHHPDYVDGVVARFKKAIAAGEPWEDTFPLRGQDRAYRWFLTRARSIRDNENRIVKWFGANTDITEKMELERELMEMNELLEQRVAERTIELRKRNDELQQFAYVASHDMQEPLRKIQTFADLAKADFGEELGYTDCFYLDRMQRACHRSFKTCWRSRV